MKTKDLLTLALVVSLALNVIFSVLFLSTFSCPMTESKLSTQVPIEAPAEIDEEQLSQLALACQEFGNWLEDYQECEWVDEDFCQDLGGSFDACTSACRHMDPEVAEFCTMECVPVCSFN